MARKKKSEKVKDKKDKKELKESIAVVEDEKLDAVIEEDFYKEDELAETAKEAVEEVNVDSIEEPVVEEVLVESPQKETVKPDNNKKKEKFIKSKNSDIAHLHGRKIEKIVRENDNGSLRCKVEGEKFYVTVLKHQIEEK